MSTNADGPQDTAGKTERRRNGMRRFIKSRDGTAAIEFAILAIPYFMIIFAIIETFVAFSAEQLLSHATNKMARELRTGQITYNLGRASDKSQAQFRQKMCDEISVLMRCSSTEIATPQKLYVDVRTFSAFANIPTAIPRVSNARFADIDTTSFRYSPGGAKSVNMMRVFYRWQIITDLVRPFITTIRPADGSMPTDFLIVATTAFQNEDFP